MGSIHPRRFPACCGRSRKGQPISCSGRASATTPCRFLAGSPTGCRRASRRASAGSGCVMRRRDSAPSRVRSPNACNRRAIATSSRPTSCSMRSGPGIALPRSTSRPSTARSPAAISVPGAIVGAWRAPSRAGSSRERRRAAAHPGLERRRRPRPWPAPGDRWCPRDREQSGTPPSLTLHRPLRAHRRSDGAFQVDGTPTDCVLLALGALMPAAPNWVFSGVNHGPNMGEDVLYSGTVSAAMEGLSAGVPSIAISYGSFDIEHMESHRKGLERLIQRIVRVENFPGETLLNINLPPIPGDQVKGVKVTNLGSRVFHEEIATMKDPWGREVHWIGGGRVTWSGGADSDFQAVKDGYISVTPLHVDLTNYKLLEVVRKWDLGK